VPETSLRAPETCLGVPVSSLKAPQITIELSGTNTISFGNTAGVPGNHRYYLLLNSF